MHHGGLLAGVRHFNPAQLRKAVRALGEGVLGAALPPLCPGCRTPLSQVGGLCAACWSKLSFIAKPYCPRLGIPFAYDPGPGILSLEAIAAPPAYNRARAVAQYDDTAAALVHALKYGDRMDLAPAMGRWMFSAGQELLEDADALVPVPLHWRRLWARRFNQSAALARAIGKLSGRQVATDLLRRVKATPQQVGLTRDERARNVQGAFRVIDPGVVLIDDVLTSGATVEACARRLLRAGAENVDVLVFARVVHPTRIPI
jgi:ComF family protein